MTDKAEQGSARRRVTFPTSWRRAAPAIVTAGLAAYLLWCVRSILTPFFVALFLAALLDPVVARLQTHGVSRTRAVGSIFLLALGAIVLAGVLILPPVVAQVTDLATNVTVYAENVTRTAERLTRQADRWYESHRPTLTSLGMNDKPSEMLQKQAGPMSAAVRDVLDTVRKTLAGMLSQVLWLIIVPVSLFYFLLEYPILRKRFVSLLPVARRREVDRILQDVIEIFSAYVRGLSKVCVLYAMTAGVLLWILRLKYALFLGAVAGVFYAVPYVGPALSVISIAVIAVTTGKSMAFTALAMFLFVLMHLAYDYGVTPRVIGGSVGLHPLVNIFALMCGVTLFGVWGMILAVPVAASIKCLLVHFFPRLTEPPILDDEQSENPSPS